MIHKKIIKKKADITLRQYLTHEGEILKYQLLEVPFPMPFMLLQGRTDISILKDLRSLYLKNLLPASPEYSEIVLYSCDDHISDPFPERDGPLVLKDPASRVRWWLEKLGREGSVEEYPSVREYLELLEKKKRLIRGGGQEGRSLYLPVYPKMTRLSNFYSADRATFNSHFFLMEISDLLSPFDEVGEPYGMLAVDGKILMPPVYSRETLISYSSGKKDIINLSIEDMIIVIDGQEYRNLDNCEIFRRPLYAASPCQKGLDIAICGSKIKAYSTEGNLVVPEAGYILHIERESFPKKLDVSYRYRDDLEFAVQVGPAMVKNREICQGFHSSYFHGEGVEYPPTVYPLDWKSGRAARTGLGFKEDRLVLIGIEGSKKAVYRAGVDSPGCSLEEMAVICQENGIENMVNLDGGGSSQISVLGKRSLKISDRSPESGKDFERPVPLGIGLTIR